MKINDLLFSQESSPLGPNHDPKSEVAEIFKSRPQILDMAQELIHRGEAAAETVPAQEAAMTAVKDVVQASFQSQVPQERLAGPELSAAEPALTNPEYIDRLAADFSKELGDDANVAKELEALSAEVMNADAMANDARQKIATYAIPTAEHIQEIPKDIELAR